MYIDGTAHGASIRFPCSLNIAHPPSSSSSSTLYMDFSACMSASVYIRGDPSLFKASEASDIYSWILLFARDAAPIQLTEDALRIASVLAGGSSLTFFLLFLLIGSRRGVTETRVHSS